jgi:G3E family GTPase
LDFNPNWIKQVVEHKSEIEEYGFMSKVIRYKEPINSNELFIELDRFKKEHDVIRIKGYVVDKMGISLEINESKTTRLLKDITDDYKFPYTNIAIIYR